MYLLLFTNRKCATGICRLWTKPEIEWSVPIFKYFVRTLANSVSWERCINYMHTQTHTCIHVANDGRQPLLLGVCCLKRLRSKYHVLQAQTEGDSPWTADYHDSRMDIWVPILQRVSIHFNPPRYQCLWGYEKRPCPSNHIIHFMYFYRTTDCLTQAHKHIHAWVHAHRCFKPSGDLLSAPFILSERSWRYHMAKIIIV